MTLFGAGLPRDPDEIITIGPCPNCGGPPVEIRAIHLMTIIGYAQGIHHSTHVTLDIDAFAIPGVDWTDYDVPRQALLRVAVAAENQQPMI